MLAADPVVLYWILVRVVFLHLEYHSPHPPHKSSWWIIITKWKFQSFFLDDSCDTWHDLTPKNTFWTKGNPVIYTLENRHGTQKSRSSSNDDPFQLADVELFFLIFSCISTLPSRMGHVLKPRYHTNSNPPGQVSHHEKRADPQELDGTPNQS